MSDELAAEAIGAAGDLAAILQAARRHKEMMVLLDDAEIMKIGIFSFLDQVQSSLLLLASADDVDAGGALDDEDVEVFLMVPAVAQYMNPRL